MAEIYFARLCFPLSRQPHKQQTYSASICINETAAISGWLVGLCSDYLLHKSMHECPWTPKLTYLFLPHHTSFTPFRNHSWKHLRQPLYIFAMRKFKFKIRLKSFKSSTFIVHLQSPLHLDSTGVDFHKYI